MDLVAEERTHLQRIAIRVDPDSWEADEDSCNRLADSLLRQIAGFLDRNSARTQRSPRNYPAAVRDWLKQTLALGVVQSLPRGKSIVVGDGRWAGCLIAYLGASAPNILSFAYWVVTSADSRVCGGASLDLTEPDDPVWTWWIQ